MTGPHQFDALVFGKAVREGVCFVKPTARLRIILEPFTKAIVEHLSAANLNYF
jgi:hypothetical protein